MMEVPEQQHNNLRKKKKPGRAAEREEYHLDVLSIDYTSVYY
ncbi:MAG: hypothetical protein ACLTS6_15015 [Anaerobutyricum sp.]